MKYHVIINTYQRPEMVKRLCAQLLEQRDCFIMAYNDGGDPVEIPGVHMTNVEHHGRELYYKLITLNFEDAFTRNWDYCIKIDDDMEIIHGFFEKIERLYPNDATTLNILRDDRMMMWGSARPQIYNHDLLDSDWVDLNFVCQRRFIDFMQRQTLQPPTVKTSSGVARQITRMIREAGGKMLQVKESLLFHGNHESKMNPNRAETGEILVTKK